MTRDEAEKLVFDYKDLVNHAVNILNKPGPPWGYIIEESWARLSFKGDQVVITYPVPEINYDSPIIETQTVKFPAILLFMTSEELSTWRAQAKIEYDREQEQARVRQLANEEEAERQMYNRLKQKYG